jgi:fumarylacetoacetate (FAA) hydrolase
MILGSIRSLDGAILPDGEAVLVNRARSHVALLPPEETSSLLHLIENWEVKLPRLREIQAALEHGSWSETRPLGDLSFMAPLPRTWCFLDGSAFVQHVRLVRKARSADLPADLLTTPLMYQGVSDNLLGPTDDIPLLNPEHGMDFESEVAVITNFVPRGTTADQAAKHILFVTIMNDVSLRELIPREVGTGFGFLQSKPPSSFAPYVLTPDELGPAWQEGRLCLPIETRLNGEIFGNPTAQEMHFSFFDLIEYAARTRPLSAGTIIGSGTVSNENPEVGSSCIVERRMLEIIATGVANTPYLHDGDEVTISVTNAGLGLFGTIRQRIRQL